MTVVIWLLSLGWLVMISLGAIGRSLESGTWEGFFTAGRTGRVFRPCGSRMAWWVQNPPFGDAADELDRRYQAIVSRPYEPVYVRIRGQASRKGQYGPLGSYQRVLYVEEVLEIREQREGDCKKKGRA
ncbi:MAG TPA: hypothetical protein ENL34_07270 [Chloroflexi bacterium]|nr:hypothetical protein [Chloroflexota bacterium]